MKIYHDCFELNQDIRKIIDIRDDLTPMMDNIPNGVYRVFHDDIQQPKDVFTLKGSEFFPRERICFKKDLSVAHGLYGIILPYHDPMFNIYSFQLFFKQLTNMPYLTIRVGGFSDNVCADWEGTSMIPEEELRRQFLVPA